MRVARRGKDLAVRIPAAVAAALELKAGDEVEVIVKTADEWEVEKKAEGAEAQPANQSELTPGWKFDREKRGPDSA